MRGCARCPIQRIVVYAPAPPIVPIKAIPTAMIRWTVVAEVRLGKGVTEMAVPLVGPSLTICKVELKVAVKVDPGTGGGSK